MKTPPASIRDLRGWRAPINQVEMLPRVLPFLILLIGVMIALYGGFATPSETAGLGALLALALIAVVYRIWRPCDVAPLLRLEETVSRYRVAPFAETLLFVYRIFKGRAIFVFEGAQVSVGLRLVEQALVPGASEPRRVRESRCRQNNDLFGI